MPTKFLPKSKRRSTQGDKATEDGVSPGDVFLLSVWARYGKQAKAYDMDLEKDWNDDLDVLLILVCYIFGILHTQVLSRRYAFSKRASVSSIGHFKASVVGRIEESPESPRYRDVCVSQFTVDTFWFKIKMLLREHELRLHRVCTKETRKKN